MISIVMHNGILYEEVGSQKYEIKSEAFKEITYMEYYNDKVKVPSVLCGVSLKAIFWTSTESSYYKIVSKDKENYETICEYSSDYFYRVTQYNALDEFTRNEIAFVCFSDTLRSRVMYRAYPIRPDKEYIIVGDDENVRFSAVAIY